MRTIAIVNQKGGCGKTTTAINLAAVYALRGVRTLLVDMDPQSHCSVGLGVPEGRTDYSMAEALVADLDRSLDVDSLVWEVSRCLHLAPSTIRLAALEAPGGGLHRLPDKDRRLERLLERLDDRFDCCLIDCPPTIGLLTFNALRAAREALIPVETGFFAMKGAARQWATIQKTIEHIGRPIACHLLPTLHKPQLKISREILASLRRDFAGQIVPVVIREHDELRAAATFGQPVLEYAPDSDAHEDFRRLADWLDAHRSEPPLQVEIVAGTHATSATTRREMSAATATGELPSGSRAAELASRVRELTPRETPVQVDVGVDVDVEPPRRPTPPPLPAPIATPPPLPVMRPPAAPVVTRPEPAEPAEPSKPLVEDIKGAAASRSASHLHGVRLTSQGALFVQPGEAGRRVAIAGDFNGWSPMEHPLSYNGQLGVFQAIIPLDPGQYQYRVVVDGCWQADPFNSDRHVNEYGETNSILIVPARQGQT